MVDRSRRLLGFGAAAAVGLLASNASAQTAFVGPSTSSYGLPGIQISSYRYSTDPDDTLSFTRAFTALTALGGGNLLLAGRTYAVSSFLTPPDKVTLVGVPGVTTIDFAGCSSYASGVYDGLIKFAGTGVTATQALTSSLIQIGTGANLASATRASTTATYTTVEDHGLASNDYVWIIYPSSGVAAGNLYYLTQAASSENHEWTVPIQVTVTGAKTFTTPISASANASLTIATSCYVYKNGLAAIVADTTGFAEGDLLQVTSDDTVTLTDAQAEKYGEFNRVARVVSSTMLILAWKVRADYTVSASASIKKLSMTRGGMHGIIIRGKGANLDPAEGNGDRGIFARYAESFLLSDCGFENCDQMGVHLLNCFNASVVRQHGTFPRSDESGLISGYIDYQYGIAYGSSEQVLIDAPRIEGGRHAVVESTTATSPTVGLSRNVTIRDAQCRGQWSNSIATHFIYQDVEISGGFLSSKASGIDGRAGRLNISDVIINGALRGVNLFGSCENILVDGIQGYNIGGAVVSIQPTEATLASANVRVSNIIGDTVERGVYILFDAGIPAPKPIFVGDISLRNISYEAVRIALDTAAPAQCVVRSVSCVNVGVRTGSSCVFLTNVLNPDVSHIYADEGTGALVYLVNVSGTASTTGSYMRLDGIGYSGILNLASTITGARTDAFVLETLTVTTSALAFQFVTTRLAVIDIASSGNLDTITGLGVGQAVALRITTGARTVTVRDQATSGGNIQTAGSASQLLDSTRDFIQFMDNNGEVVQLSLLVSG